MAAAADFPARGAVGFGFAGACVGVCANVCIVSQNNPTRIAAANFRIVVPSLLLESKGLLPDQFPADTLHFGHDAQGIFAQNLLYVTFGITFFQECVGDFRKLGGVFHAIWHVSAIEIRTQPHVIDASNLHSVVDMLDDFCPIDARELSLLAIYACKAAAFETMAGFIVAAALLHFFTH